MNTQHLTAAIVDGYRARALASYQLLVVAEHLANCEECRQKAATNGEAGKLLEALGGEHLPYESLEAIVLGSREGLGHIAVCAMCAEELSDLRSFHASLRKPSRAWRGSRVLVPVIGFAIVLAMVSVGLFLHTRSIRKGAAPGAASLTPSLQDGGRVISLDQSGGVSGFDGVSADERRQIAEVLRSGVVAVAPGEPDLFRSRETLLGAPAERSVLTPAAPAGIVVLSDRPAFHWNAPRNARDFRIAIYDANFDLVENSPTVQGEVWLSTRSLPRGKVFSWTVSALLGTERVTVPQAPDPEAKFRVATAKEAGEMDAVRQTVPVSDLRIAMTAARLGFRDEAREALERLRARNPDTPLVPHLSEQPRANTFSK
jgi:hypothetical protein